MAKSRGQVGCLLEPRLQGSVHHGGLSETTLVELGVNWCIGSGGPCLGCTEPWFSRRVHPVLSSLGLGERHHAHSCHRQAWTRSRGSRVT